MSADFAKVEIRATRVGTLCAYVDGKFLGAVEADEYVVRVVLSRKSLLHDETGDVPSILQPGDKVLPT